MKKLLKTTVLLLLVLFALMQLKRIDKSVPEYDPTLDFIAMSEQGNSDQARLIKAACYDCHSYETKYPWYSNLAPISWWIEDHVNHGRGEFNFSEWGTYTQSDRKHILKECIEQTEKRGMPMESYIKGHPEARLSDEQIAELSTFFKSMMK